MTILTNTSNPPVSELNLPSPGVSAGDVASHGGGPTLPDVSLIQQMANTLFRAPPNGVLQQTPPATPPSPTLMPAPSVVTTVAPYAPAQAPVAPPDMPPTTIPSVVPTPTYPAPVAPGGVPLTFTQTAPEPVPQPGGSAGLFLPPVPSSNGLGALPKELADLVRLVPREHQDPQAPAGNTPNGAHVPADLAQPSDDGFYFLRDGSSLVKAPSAPPSFANPVQPQPDFKGVS